VSVPLRWPHQAYDGSRTMIPPPGRWPEAGCADTASSDVAGRSLSRLSAGPDQVVG